MISPEEIKQQALKWWTPFLQSYVTNEPFFPKQIDRIGKVQPGDITHRFETVRNEIDALYQHSKEKTGIGYLVKKSENNFRRTGSHNLPEYILFETADDFLHYTGKVKEWRLFQRNYQLLMQCLPKLKEWILYNVDLLALAQTKWEDILKVCHYFIENPRPQLYIRQLPIRVHSKFIEENTTILQSLLDYLIPDNIRDNKKNKFAERYYLKHDEPLIRIRILDKRLAIYNNITDLSIRLSKFEQTDWACDTILITENKMNFLTLPPISSAIAIWSGGGFNVSYLSNTTWLKGKRIYYWGDIDEHGFQILHQIRCYFPHTQSLMMDKETFNSFEEFAVDGKRNKAEQLSLLNSDEASLYDWLRSKENKNRLEQEKITQGYVDMILSKIQ